VEGVRLNPCGRLPDLTPITLAELHSIHAVLAWQEVQDRHEDTIIHSRLDGNHQNARTYPEITTEIIDSASTLSHRGSLTTLN